MFADASEWFADQITDWLAVKCQYSRGGSKREIDAVFGSTSFEIDDDDGGRITSSAVDVIVKSAQIAGLFYQPVVGDRVTTADGRVFEVLELGAAGHWRYCDAHANLMRIHLRLIDKT
ncbi:MAG TPA: hypothetical protein VLH56_11830 [Dissulfurispiraceae bacterium]|nr:hypothetical protein [Dissulfurispiraceae bacterium]